MHNFLSSFLAVGFFVSAASVSLLPASASDGPQGEWTFDNWIVIDGDTLHSADRRVKIRLYGIDAPELGQDCFDPIRWACGASSATYLETLIAGRSVTCVEIGKDRYRRSVAICRNAQGDIGEQMVAQGWVLEYKQYSDGRYNEAERAAQTERRGLWISTCFVKPWEWRREKRCPSDP